MLGRIFFVSYMDGQNCLIAYDNKEICKNVFGDDVKLMLEILKDDFDKNIIEGWTRIVIFIIILVYDPDLLIKRYNY